MEEPPVLELKPLPDHLGYAFLGENDILLVIIAKSFTGAKREAYENIGLTQAHIRMDHSQTSEGSSWPW